MEQKRKIKLTFLGGKNLQCLVRECAPLHYSKGQVEGDGLDSYYIWDFETSKDDHFLSLPPSQIIKMVLAEGGFNIDDFTARKKRQENQQLTEAPNPAP